MGIMSALKNKILRREPVDTDYMRTSVLGDRNFNRPDFSRPEPTDFSKPKSIDLERFEPPASLKPQSASFTREPIDMRDMEYEEPGFENMAEPPHGSKPVYGASGSDKYDVIDRLNFIENQLSAIKSQTETINERLKNIDMKLSQRRF